MFSTHFLSKSKWPTMQSISKSHNYDGLELLLQILRNTICQNNVSSHWLSRVRDLSCRHTAHTHAHTRTLHFQMLFSVFLICWRSCLTCQTRVELKPCYKDATCVERYNIGGKIFYHYSSSFLLSLLHALPFSTKSTSSLRLELESMLERGVKFEIEALSVHNISFLSDEYLPSKIESELTLLNS